MKSTYYKTVNKGNSLKSFLIAILLFFLLPIIIPIIYIAFTLFSLFFTPVLDNLIPNEMKEPACIGITIIFTLIAYILWFILGRDKHVTQIVSVDPPKDMNSAEIELNYYGHSSERGVKSLIYYLASKDYLKIEKLNNNYILRKLKPYDGNDEAEKVFFEGIFGDDIDAVNLNRLISSTSFNLLCVNVQILLNNLYKDNFKSNATLVSKVIMVLICSLGIGLSLLYTIADYSFKLIISPISFLFLFTFLAIWLAVYYCCNYEQMKDSVEISSKNKETVENFKKHRKIYTLMLQILICVMFGGIPFLFIVPQSDILKFNHPIQIIFELVCLIISFICVNNMPQLSRKGRELKGLARGFKRFLEVTEKRRFDELIGENPNYAREIYPYAFALGITESYITDFYVLSASQSYSGDNFDPESIKRINNLLKKNGVN